MITRCLTWRVISWSPGLLVSILHITRKDGCPGGPDSPRRRLIARLLALILLALLVGAWVGGVHHHLRGVHSVVVVWPLGHVLWDPRVFGGGGRVQVLPFASVVDDDDPDQGSPHHTTHHGDDDDAGGGGFVHAALLAGRALGARLDVLLHRVHKQVGVVATTAQRVPHLACVPAAVGHRRLDDDQQLVVGRVEVPLGQL